VAVEEQFYLVWPAIILLTPNTKFRLRVFPILILLVLLARTAWYLSSPHYDGYGYYNTFFRMDGFLMGSLFFQLYDARIDLPAKWVRTFTLALLAILITGCMVAKNAFPSNPFFATAGFTLLALFFGCLLHLALQPGNNALANFLNSRFLRFCGRISYCLYLIHIPILQVIASKLRAYGASHWPGHESFSRFLSVSIALILSFLLSSISYRYLESWFLKYKARGSVRA
jgi:peptidoglycan/LPS O-acetylase OafA/YrhL